MAKQKEAVKIVKFGDDVGQKCDHSKCNLATCAWDVCASTHWEERRQHAIMLHPEATSGEIHARM
jgi:hypothetical protein